MQQYNHVAIERKWQKYWEENKIFQSDVDTSQPKYYVLDMFPYPSGSGLHVGHVVGYSATDIVARFKRMMGYNVLHPMGWDSFGLPAEQYAIRTGTHPKETTQQNIENFKRQLKLLGFSYDWDREIATSDANYYKWTQWIFTKLYEKGLAYEAQIPVNFCPHLGTVLANEEVDNGTSKEGGYEVVRIPLRQWILKITEYADRLLEDLDDLDWPLSVKLLQKNWIGKSEGLSIEFAVVNSHESISVFTTRHDTICGVTFLVLAPEHPMLSQIISAEYHDDATQYIESAKRKDDLQRTDLNKIKTGVFTGAFCIHPILNTHIPIWIADYVLPGYGSGAVMGVPGHDERDHEFAHKYNLAITHVICKTTDEKEKIQDSDCVIAGDEGFIINSCNEDKKFSLNGMAIHDAKLACAKWFEEQGLGKRTVHYKLRDWLFSRQRYWGEPIPILHFEDGTKRCLGIDELPLMPPELKDFRPSGDGKSPLSRVHDWVYVSHDPLTNRPAVKETNTMPQWAGSCWYYLRFIDPKNNLQAWDSKKELYWLPVDLYVGGVEHAVLHLLYSRFWHKVLYDLGLVHSKEPFKSLRNQGLVVARSYKNSSNTYVDPHDVYEDKGVYFHTKTHEILTSQIEKMSKSKLNGISPDDILANFGADALRMYEMFMGPLEKEKVWNNDAIVACRRFLIRAFELVQSDKCSDDDLQDGMRMAHKLVAKAREDYEALQFNTLIAKMMEFVNEFTKLACYPKKALEFFVLVLSPIAPHVAEEMWQLLGHKEASLAFEPFPQFDPNMIIDNMVTYVIQVNGKLRGRLEFAVQDEEEGAIVQTAQQHPNVMKFLDGVVVRKTIFVRNKLINFVV